MALDDLDDLLENQVTQMRQEMQTRDGRVTNRVFTALGRILREGRPASMDEIAEAAGLAHSDVAEICGQAEKDSEGRIIGLGLSFIPTLTKVLFEDIDHALYAWCPPDALVASYAAGVPARVITRCAATGEQITIFAGPREIEDVQPSTAVTSSAPLYAVDPRNPRETGCSTGMVFVSPEAARQWYGDEPHFPFLSIPDMFRYTVRLMQRVNLVPSAAE